MKKIFPFFQYYKKIIYFDNSSTNQKPRIFFKSLLNCIKKNNFNINRGDYKQEKKNFIFFKKIKLIIKNLINNNFIEEIILLFNSTYSVNFLFYSLFNFLKKNDEIITSKIEHNSLILPLINLIKKKNIKIIYFKLIKKIINLNIFCNQINNFSKIIIISHITNIGNINNIKKISKISHFNNLIIIIDSTQSISYIKININKVKVDFLFFSIHKLFSSTGISILYYNIFYLNKLDISFFGSAIINNFNYKMLYLKKYNLKFETGTQNLIALFSSYYSIKWFLCNKKIFFFVNKYLKEIFFFLNKKKKKKIINIYLIKTNNNFLFNFFINLNKIILRCDNLCNIRILFKKKNNCRISLNFFNNIKEILKIKFLIFFFNFKI